MRAKEWWKGFWRESNAWRLSLLLLLALVMGPHGLAMAESSIQVKTADLTVADEAYLLKAEFETSFGATLEEAINKGVPLVFVVEFELERSRWYWLDETVVMVKREYRLNYHALTKQYYLQGGDQQKAYATLAELRTDLDHPDPWVVFDRSVLKKRHTYTARLRMRLDLSQLPKPLQVSALTSRDWNVESAWQAWAIKATH